MFTLSNALSLIRGPLAFLFLIDRVEVRSLVLIIAGVTDFVDGYIARRYKNTSKVGAFLDPIMDKFFVFFVLTVFFLENKISSWGLFFMMSRDISYLFFGIYLVSKRRLKQYSFRPLFGGKAMTLMQFLVLFLLSLNVYIPSNFYVIFFFCGMWALLEVFYKEISMPTQG